MADAADQLRAALRQADAEGRGEEARAAARAVESGLRWFADELGESRQPVGLLGEKRFIEIHPLTAVFAVHLGRRDVHVSRFGLVRRRP
jgi:hypothetical protein